MGRRQGPPGWGKRGLQSGPCRQAVRPRGRRGAAPLRGQRGGTRRVERDLAGPGLTYEGTAARDPPATGPGRSGEPRGRSRASGRSGARQGRRRVGGPRSPAASRAAVEGKAARLVIGTAVRGWRLRGAPPRAAGKSRGAGTGAVRPSPRPPACYKPEFRQKGQGRTPPISLAVEGINRQKGRNSARHHA